jgi:hypothetical protein
MQLLLLYGAVMGRFRVISILSPTDNRQSAYIPAMSVLLCSGHRVLMPFRQLMGPRHHQSGVYLRMTLSNSPQVSVDRADMDSEPLRHLRIRQAVILRQ